MAFWRVFARVLEHGQDYAVVAHPSSYPTFEDAILHTSEGGDPDLAVYIVETPTSEEAVHRVTPVFIDGKRDPGVRLIPRR